MADRSHKLSLAREADLLGISRGSFSFEPHLTKKMADTDLRAIMRELGPERRRRRIIRL
jgi:hypothetical protein